MGGQRTTYTEQYRVLAVGRIAVSAQPRWLPTRTIPMSQDVALLLQELLSRLPEDLRRDQVIDSLPGKLCFTVLCLWTKVRIARKWIHNNNETEGYDTSE